MVARPSIDVRIRQHTVMYLHLPGEQCFLGQPGGVQRRCGAACSALSSCGALLGSCRHKDAEFCALPCPQFGEARFLLENTAFSGIPRYVFYIIL
jgi:hypothetical protein